MIEAGRQGTGQAGAGDAPWRLQVFEHLGSTADLCRTLAEAGEPEGLAILARRQSAGRGTRGRSWSGAAGNLFLSVLLRPREPARNAPHWSLLAGVALHDALARHLPDPRALRLKWPNDLLLDGRKLAGILAESAADGQGGMEWLSLGLGANLAAAPDLADRPTACLAERVPPPPADTVAADVLDRLAHWRAARREGGFACVRAAFLARTQAPGTPLSLATGDRRLDGAFVGLDENGNLLVEIGGRVRAFASGEVTIGNRT